MEARCVEPVGGTETAKTKPAEETATAREALEPKHVGGGWYQLPGGERVKGRAEARRRMEG